MQIEKLRASELPEPTREQLQCSRCLRSAHRYGALYSIRLANLKQTVRFLLCQRCALAMAWGLLDAIWPKDARGER